MAFDSDHILMKENRENKEALTCPCLTKEKHENIEALTRPS